MSIFDANEQVEFIATQSLHYDRYACCRYFLERVAVDGKCGLVCGEEQDGYSTHSKVILEPVYRKIEIHKISSQKAIYDKYEVYADGSRIGTFTLVLNAWVPGQACHSEEKRSDDEAISD